MNDETIASMMYCPKLKMSVKLRVRLYDPCSVIGTICFHTNAPNLTWERCSISVRPLGVLSTQPLQKWQTRSSTGKGCSKKKKSPCVYTDPIVILLKVTGARAKGKHLLSRIKQCHGAYEPKRHRIFLIWVEDTVVWTASKMWRMVVSIEKTVVCMPGQ